MRMVLGASPIQPFLYRVEDGFVLPTLDGAHFDLNAQVAHFVVQ
jgi:hypothetical protein